MIELVPRHLGATDGYARCVLIDHARHQSLVLVAPILRTIRLRIDDDVGQEQVAAAGIVEIAGKRFGARFVVPGEDVEPDALADQRRGEVIGRTPHEAEAAFRPGGQGAPALYHLGIGTRYLPAAVDAAVGAVEHERHALDVFRRRLES